ncbi:MAG: hypothetical protein AB7V43_03290 [Acidimicrobiia bacterium]
MTEKHALVVLSNAVDGRDEEFNTWYDKQHLPDVLSVPGFVAAQRYTANPAQMGEAPLTHKYLAIYEIEGDIGAALGALGSAVEAGMDISSMLDMDTVSAVVFTPNGPRQVTKNT